MKVCMILNIPPLHGISPDRRYSRPAWGSLHLSSGVYSVVHIGTFTQRHYIKFDTWTKFELECMLSLVPSQCYTMGIRCGTSSVSAFNDIIFWFNVHCSRECLKTFISRKKKKRTRLVQIPIKFEVMNSDTKSPTRTATPWLWGGDTNHIIISKTHLKISFRPIWHGSHLICTCICGTLSERGYNITFKFHTVDASSTYIFLLYRRVFVEHTGEPANIGLSRFCLVRMKCLHGECTRLVGICSRHPLSLTLINSSKVFEARAFQSFLTLLKNVLTEVWYDWTKTWNISHVFQRRSNTISNMTCVSGIRNVYCSNQLQVQFHSFELRIVASQRWSETSCNHPNVHMYSYVRRSQAAGETLLPFHLRAASNLSGIFYSLYNWLEWRSQLLPRFHSALKKEFSQFRLSVLHAEWKKENEKNNEKLIRKNKTPNSMRKGRKNDIGIRVHII